MNEYTDEDGIEHIVSRAEREEWDEWMTYNAAIMELRRGAEENSSGCLVLLFGLAAAAFELVRWLA